jgi:hypothetical protein
MSFLIRRSTKSLTPTVGSEIAVARKTKKPTMTDNKNDKPTDEASEDFDTTEAPTTPIGPSLSARTQPAAKEATPLPPAPTPSQPSITYATSSSSMANKPEPKRTQIPAIKEAAKQPEPESFRDPLCVHRHRANCDCKGAARGPIA